jgi:hypothetical protein
MISFYITYTFVTCVVLYLFPLRFYAIFIICSMRKNTITVVYYYISMYVYIVSVFLLMYSEQVLSS